MALATRDLDADLAALAKMGVELIGPPARVVVNGVASPGRFVCFKDPDGTVLELVEARDGAEVAARATATAEGRA